MIAKISGTLAYKAPGEVIVDVGGVGYHLFISLGVFYCLPEIGGPVSLLVHTHVREDALQLFGFLEVGEKEVFLLLNGVAGIGPKLAVNILSGIPAGDLVRAIKEGDQLRLISIPGVGKRLAERMVVELRDKLEASTIGVSPGAGDGSSQLMKDAVSALVNLGYRRPESEKAVREIVKKEQGNLEEVLKQALRSLSQ
ncbi:MAG: Holliday junction branch migration protein RuvA [Candidatus Binatia bacterium]|jgi:Holliday junction DNA helicase RuvA|nr:Holliday junction branch migration protein RuvA [Candidatus Binatia bacterium]